MYALMDEERVDGFEESIRIEEVTLGNENRLCGSERSVLDAVRRVRRRQAPTSALPWPLGIGAFA